jgi:hypothetical protein
MIVALSRLPRPHAGTGHLKRAMPSRARPADLASALLPNSARARDHRVRNGGVREDKPADERAAVAREVVLLDSTMNVPTSGNAANRSFRRRAVAASLVCTAVGLGWYTPPLSSDSVRRFRLHPRKRDAERRFGWVRRSARKLPARALR